MRFLLFLLAAVLPAADTFPPRAVTQNVSVIEGPVNGVLVRSRGKMLAIYGDPRPKPARVDRVLFTHNRRDVAWAGQAMVETGAEAVIPAAESGLFTDVQEFWNRYWMARFHDYAMESSKVLSAPFARVTAVRGGDRIDWEGIGIQVLDSPGYTRGAVSYLFEIDGKRIACTGDLIHGDGRILDLYSLQDSIPETREDGYHGYAARAADVVASLRKIAAWRPDLLIPARGPVIRDPRQAIDTLIRRLQAVLESHFAIDALRWYRGDEKLRVQARRVLGSAPVRWMPMAETIREKLPEWIVPVSNSRLIVSKSGAAFLVDCGSRKILETVKQLRRQGRFKTLDGIFATHYHDDHTDQLQSAADEFHCQVYSCPQMRDILERPGAYRMPAGTANPVRNVTVVEDGEKRRWNEFGFTYSFFPGQTLYHGALLVKSDAGETIFFIGDSFTPSGIDDYCLLNRNFVPPQKGFLTCLNALRTMPPDHLLINEHVLPAFRFSPQQVEFMIDNFTRRAKLMRDLFPWDDPNFGLDEQWARFYPYGVEACGGRPLQLQFAILNHSPSTRTYRVTPHLPPSWTVSRRTISLTIPARQERFASITITPPPEARGVNVITADVSFGRWDLRHWAEAVVRVE